MFQLHSVLNFNVVLQILHTCIKTNNIIDDIVADPGWRDSRPTLGATLTTAVSGVYNAGRLGTGLGSRVFNRDTNVILVPYQLGK